MLIYYVVFFVAIVLEAFPISSSTHYNLIITIFNAITSVTIDPNIVFFIDHGSHAAIALVLAFFFWKQWSIFLYNPKRSFFILLTIIYLGFITDVITTFFYGLLQYTQVDWFPVWLGFGVTAIALYSLRYIKDATYASWNPFNAILLGLAQSCALLPGISRFAITYATARWSGIRAARAFQISFLIEFPLSLAGALYAWFRTYKLNILFSVLNYTMVAVMLVAMLCLYGALCIIDYMIKNNKLWMFSWYVAILSVIFLVL